MPQKQELFIPPHTDLNQGDSALSLFVELSKETLQKRWHTKHGSHILTTWEKSGYNREALNSLVGQYYGHTDLRGVNLHNADLTNANLRSIDFFGSNLEKCNLSRADLTDSWLSESNIKGTNFNWAKMDNVLIDKVIFDKNTTFYGVNLNQINFTLAALLRELVIGQQRIHQLTEQHPLLSFCFRATCDYGRSFFRFGLWVVGLITLFATLYTFIPGSTNTSSFLSNLYFSTITFTTLGYGDILPISLLGKTFVCFEVITGYIMLGLLVAIISKRVVG